MKTRVVLLLLFTLNLLLPLTAFAASNLRIDARVARALEASTSVSASNIPLPDLLDRLRLQVPLLIDHAGLTDAGIEAAQIKIGCQLNQLPLRCVLTLILEPQGLNWFVKNESIVVTTSENSESRELHSLAVFPVDVLRSTPPDTLNMDSRQLEDALFGFYLPADTTAQDLAEAMNAQDPTAATAFQNMSVVVTGPMERLYQSKQIFEALRRAKRISEHAGESTPRVTSIGPADATWPAVERALARQSEWDLPAMSLDQLAQRVRTRFRINVVIDEPALRDAGLSPANVQRRGLQGSFRLESLLYHLLDPRELTFVTWQRALLITTRERAESSRFQHVRIQRLLRAMRIPFQSVVVEP